MLRSKLSPPVVGSSIQRARLQEWLDHVPQIKLALIQAPAGFGKTTVMLQLLSRLGELGVATAWLTVDEADNDKGRFMAYLAGALQAIDPELAVRRSAGDPFGDGAAVSPRAPDILQWVVECEKPFALFLDDFEVVTNPEVLGLVREVVAGLSSGQLLAVATRRVPDLGIGRLRVLGHLLEVEAEDLRFAWDETDRFLRIGRGLDLGDEELARLQTCTEGWAAGLQLAALALTGHHDRETVISSFSGSFSDIADYLAEDVLSRQPDEVQDFLLTTCILDRLSGPLCDAVGERTGSYELLSYLERAGLFLMPLDAERRWYRYHHLFAEFLRGRLERRHPGRATGLHRQAADWFAEQNLPVEAAKHALAAGDLDRAAGLVARCAMTLVQLGQLRTVADWVDRLPSPTLDRHPELRIALCWALSMRHQYEEARAVLEQITRGLETSDRLDPGVLDEIYCLEALVVSLTDRVQECLRLSEQNLPRITNRSSFPYSVLVNILASRLLEAGRFDEAESLLRRAYQSHVQSGSVFGATYSACLTGSAEMLQGRLRSALMHYRSALERAERMVPGSQTNAVAAVYLAEALYEMDEVDEAERLLAGSRDRFPECVPLDVMLMAYLTLARIRVLRGEGAAAGALLDEAEGLGEERRIPRVAATIHLERVRLAVQRGDVAGAERLARRRDDRAVWRAYEGWGMPACDPETPQVGELRLLVRSGRAREAIAPLREELEKADSSRRRRRALKIDILLAEALAAAGDKKAGLWILRRALVFGNQEGYVRAFVDEGLPVLRLVDELRRTRGFEPADGQASISPAYLDRILSGGDGGDRVRAASKPWPVSAQPLAGTSAPAEPLTAREAEVLQMVAAGLSNQALADHLFVSVPTVKFHLRNINAKLGAHSRTLAVAKARQLGLLS
ncbi:MAG: LuxR C-terminal-related transcriptional regulator [Thermoleophilia bacterium]|nr:LuxR C-terminal-related transcriptional regulator [Thermoleophilia bacterium]